MLLLPRDRQLIVLDQEAAILRDIGFISVPVPVVRIAGVVLVVVDVLVVVVRTVFLLRWTAVVVERYTDCTSVVTTVLADDATCSELPETSVVVTADGNEVGAVGGEGTVPDPALVGFECGFEREGSPLVY